MTPAHNPDRELEDEIVDTMLSFMRVMRSAKSVPGVEGLTLAQLQVVMAISESDSPSMAHVAKQLNLSLPTVSVAVDKLVRADYVERQNDPSDRRIIRVRLTKKGQKIMQKMCDEKAAVIKSVLAQLTSAEKKKTQDVMSILLHALDEGTDNE